MSRENILDLTDFRRLLAEPKHGTLLYKHKRYCCSCHAWHGPCNKDCTQRQRQAVKDTLRGMGT